MRAGWRGIIAGLLVAAAWGGFAVGAHAQTGSAASATAVGAGATGPRVDYARAERLIGWNSAMLVRGEASAPTFIEDSDRFWYRVRTDRGNTFIRVDPAAGTRAPLFDNARLAAALSMANDTSYDPVKLPFTTLDVLEDGRAIRMRVGQRWMRCDIVAYSCARADTTQIAPDHHVASPDGRWEAFIHEYDLWVRPAAGGDSTRLTTDGEEFYRYGETVPGPSAQLRGGRSSPTLEWSPDSRRIAVQRMDERDVELMPIYSSTTTRPRYWLWPYALPGDSAVPSFDIHVVDVESRTNVKVDVPQQPTPMSGFAGMNGDDWVTVKWSPDGQRLYFTHHVRGRKRVQLQQADLATGRPGPVLAKDSSKTYVELNLLRRGDPNWFVVGNGSEVIWFSERDGWAHLWLYDGAGNVKNRITGGEWTVGDVLHVDERARRIWFTARGREPGRNPYYRHLYRVNFDGSGLTLLTSEDADHDITISPSGRYAVDRWSRPDDPGRAALRSLADGRIIRELETADASALEEIGWKPPRIITVKARDGVTDLWGLMYTPSHLDPSKKYPVIVHIYPGPQIGSVGVWGFNQGSRGENHGLAELGFIVVQVDALGTPYRSKAFHDAWYGNMGDNGIADQVVAVQQLAARHPWIDIARAGIYGHSGGGFSSTGAILRYPDFFKVAVSTAGNHDNRSYGSYWAEQYQGLLERDTVRSSDNYMNQVNAELAGNLKGKLFLMHGDMDDNVHPAMTIQVVDALIKANKTFDLLIVPDRAHGLNEPYIVRRRWDYFVKHLLGAEPPVDYQLRRVEG